MSHNFSYEINCCIFNLCILNLVSEDMTSLECTYRIHTRLSAHQKNRSVGFEKSWLPDVVSCFEKKKKILLFARHLLQVTRVSRNSMEHLKHFGYNKQSRCSSTSLSRQNISEIKSEKLCRFMNELSHF